MLKKSWVFEGDRPIVADALLGVDLVSNVKKVSEYLGKCEITRIDVKVSDDYEGTDYEMLGEIRIAFNGSWGNVRKKPRCE